MVGVGGPATLQTRILEKTFETLSPLASLVKFGLVASSVDARSTKTPVQSSPVGVIRTATEVTQRLSHSASSCSSSVHTHVQIYECMYV